jgi:hypothetical protein
MKSIMMASALTVLGGATAAFAQVLPPPPISVPVSLTVTDNEAFGSFDIGGIGADITITFEHVVGLVPSALDVTATLVNPLDPALLARLPGGGLVSVPVAFPVVIRISPSASSGLSFEGEYFVSFHTHNLHLDVNAPFSLFKSPDGGTFKDITKSEGRGSYRDDGGGGDFSDFLTVVDLQPINAVIEAKFDDLQSIITNNAGSMPPDVVATLQADLANARTLYHSGAIRDAIDAMRAFSSYVKAHSGADIPDVWRANCSPLVNVAGLLRSGADTLRFSLDRKLSQ